MTEPLSGKHLQNSHFSQDMFAAQWRLFAKSAFPREVRGTGEWITVKDEGEFLDFLVGQLKAKAPAHTSVYPASTPGAWSSFCVDHLVFDLDGPVMETWSNMKNLVEYIEREYAYTPRVYFTGNRGFHIYIDFQPVFDQNLMERLRILASRIASRAGISGLDYNLYTERHLIRVPYSFNEKSGHLAIGIDPSWDLYKISRYSIAGPDEFPIKAVSYSGLIRADLMAIKIKEPKPHAKPGRGSAPSYAWIEELLKHPIQDGRHRTLWHIVAPYLINVKGLSFDEAFAIAREYFLRCGQVKPLSPSESSFMRQIKYYLRVAERDGYGPWRLTTIQAKDPELYRIVTGAAEENETSMHYKHTQSPKGEEGPGKRLKGLAPGARPDLSDKEMTRHG